MMCLARTIISALHDVCNPEQFRKLLYALLRELRSFDAEMCTCTIGDKIRAEPARADSL
jgi:hypothetical protein